MHADAPVEQVVAQAFRDGLATRGLHAAPKAAVPHTLAVTIRQFDANQYVRREPLRISAPC